MDSLSHGLWAAVAAKAANKILKQRGCETRVNPWWAGFWGAFPDVFAFTPLFFWVLARIVTGAFNVNDFVSGTSGNQAMFSVSQLTGTLYTFSHSGIVLAAVFVLAWLIFRRPAPGSSLKLPPTLKLWQAGRRVPWAVGGWLLHILMDIPTHPASFYPTSFLWPLSSMRLGGISWATPWFLIVGYAALGILFFLLREKNPALPPPLMKRQRLLRLARNIAAAGFAVVALFGIYAALRTRRNFPPEPPQAVSNESTIAPVNEGVESAPRP